MRKGLFYCQLPLSGVVVMKIDDGVQHRAICFECLAAMNIKILFAFSVLQQGSGMMYLWPCREGSILKFSVVNYVLSRISV